MTDAVHTDRPNGNETNTLKGQFAYFERWMTDMEKFYEERDKRYGERFIAQDDKTTLALTASKEAISKAEAATEKRFDAVNEFREQQKDIIAEFPRRVEVDAKFINQEEKIALINKRLDISSGEKDQSRVNRTQNNWVIGLVVAAITGPMGILIGDILFRKP